MSGTELTALVVEDDPELADLYSAWLREYCTVRTAHDGSQALDVVDEGIDVVLLDRRMPGLSGEEVLDAIRSRGLDCRVAMVTGLEPEGDPTERGFTDYLLKPVSPDDLVDTVVGR